MADARQSPKLYPDSLAVRFKDRDDKYQPSNGTEGMDFMAMWCDRCKRNQAFQNDPGEDSCSIILGTMIYDVDDADYPEEWNYGPDGQPRCTAFEEIEDDG